MCKRARNGSHQWSVEEYIHIRLDLGFSYFRPIIIKLFHRAFDCEQSRSASAMICWDLQSVLGDGTNQGASGTKPRENEIWPKNNFGKFTNGSAAITTTIKLGPPISLLCSHAESETLSRCSVSPLAPYHPSLLSLLLPWKGNFLNTKRHSTPLDVKGKRLCLDEQRGCFRPRPSKRCGCSRRWWFFEHLPLYDLPSPD